MLTSVLWALREATCQSTDDMAVKKVPDPAPLRLLIKVTALAAEKPVANMRRFDSSASAPFPAMLSLHQPSDPVPLGDWSSHTQLLRVGF